MFDFIKNIGQSELILIILLILLFFGGKKLTEVASSIRESKKELLKIKEEIQSPSYQSQKIAKKKA